MTWLDFTLYLWAFALLMAELWQLWQNHVSGESHFASFWNYVIDESPYALQLALPIQREASGSS